MGLWAVILWEEVFGQVLRPEYDSPWLYGCLSPVSDPTTLVGCRPALCMFRVAELVILLADSVCGVELNVVFLY